MFNQDAIEVERELGRLPRIGVSDNYRPTYNARVSSTHPDGNGVLYIAGRNNGHLIVDQYSSPDLIISGKRIPAASVNGFLIMQYIG